MSDNKGTAPVQLTTIGGDWLSSGSPQWSPDGKQIAFDSFRNGHWGVYILTIESRVVCQLTTGSFDCNRPGWSRDGHWVYFRSRDQVRKIPAAGGAVIQVTRYGGDEPFESWDGKFVYYHKSDAIWKVSTAGGEENQVVDYAVRGHWSLMPAGICFLNRWQKPSPALEFFAFANRRRRIFAILPGLNGSFEEPALTASPDGRWVLCVLADHVESSIQLVDNFQ